MKKILTICSLEQSKKLKIAGFAWPVFEYYHPDYKGVQKHMGEEEGCNYNGKNWAPGYYSAPSLVLMAQWLREVKGLHVVACPENKAHSCNWVYSIYLRSEKDKGWMCVVVSGIINPTHDAALSEGIDKALEILIK